jgi:small GTP-binding protein
MLAWLPLAQTREAIRLLLAQPQAWRRLREEGDPVAIARARRVRSLWWMLRVPRVAIIGPANVGKSTIANQLFAQERSITADMPGTTRDWVGEIANLDGLPVLLLDTPGLRASDDPIEQQAISRSQQQVDQADLVVIVLDATQPPDDAQRELIGHYPRAVLVINKTDQPPAWDVSSIKAIRTVATRGAGIDALRSAIAARFDCAAVDFTQAQCWA